uniref:RNA-directed DNA polymerase, eukaryota n=1 Tax=Tanacetum cinerariifolium TaxID=118510 RepID=A0A6L2LQG5_TANCI|nr:RNA-directed DNA polymerase, eukaryota [Tanacetum cinerariifolium]
MYWIRAKEVPGWVSDFFEDSDDECQSEEDNVVQESLVQDDVSCGDDFEVNEIPETQFDVSHDKNRNDSEDPFGNDRNASGANSQQEKNSEIPVVQNEVRDANDSDSQASASSRSSKFKQSVAPKSGGLILCLMEELVRVGQTMGYNIEGCMNNMTEIIKSQGVTNVKLLIVAVYAPHDPRDKCLLWNYLTHVSNQWDGEVIMMGDFNEVKCKSDRFGFIFNANGAEVFNSFINNAGLVEVPLGESAYTWSHRSTNKMSKIDRFLISDNLLSSYPNISVVTLERFLSDHRPILLRESYYDYGPIPFCFFHHWLVMDGFDTFVIDVWRNIPRFSCFSYIPKLTIITDLLFEYGKYPEEEEEEQSEQSKPEKKNKKLTRMDKKMAKPGKQKKKKPSNPVKKRLLLGLHLLGFNEGYSDGLYPPCDVNIGKKQLILSVKDILASYHEPVMGTVNKVCYGWRRPLTVITVILCEAGRFHPVCWNIERLILRNNDKKLLS